MSYEHFTPRELFEFERYCNKLVILLADTTEAPSGNLARVHECLCKRPIPAGVPAEYVRSTWDECPACVLAHGQVRAVDHKLNAMVVPGSDVAARAEFFRAVRRIGTAA